MILGLGTDLVDMGRIEHMFTRFGTRFERRVFTDAEIALAHSRSMDARIATYARRFAAKEALLKALGTGLRHGISWREVEVLRDAAGKPSLHLHGKAQEALAAITPSAHETRLHLSLSDEPPLAMAVVVIETVARA